MAVGAMEANGSVPLAISRRMHCGYAVHRTMREVPPLTHTGGFGRRCLETPTWESLSRLIKACACVADPIAARIALVSCLFGPWPRPAQAPIPGCPTPRSPHEPQASLATCHSGHAWPRGSQPRKSRVRTPIVDSKAATSCRAGPAPFRAWQRRKLLATGGRLGPG